MMATFGPRPEFLAIALSNLQHATMSVRELAHLRAEDYMKVEGVLGIRDVSDSPPAHDLESIAIALSFFYRLSLEIARGSMGTRSDELASVLRGVRLSWNE
jgi:hypothetical protein